MKPSKLPNFVLSFIDQKVFVDFLAFTFTNVTFDSSIFECLAVVPAGNKVKRLSLVNHTKKQFIIIKESSLKVH